MMDKKDKWYVRGCQYPPEFESIRRKKLLKQCVRHCFCSECQKSMREDSRKESTDGKLICSFCNSGLEKKVQLEELEEQECTRCGKTARLYSKLHLCERCYGCG